MHTYRKDNIVVDLGAGWVHGSEGSFVKDLADKLKVNLYSSPISHVELTFDKEGKIIIPTRNFLEEVLAYIWLHPSKAKGI
jgi:hypothetical protein